MKSHEYAFGPWAVIRMIAPILAATLSLATILKLGDLAGIFPPPARTDIFVHQARASRAKDPAEMVLLGDSTCLTDVDAIQLSSVVAGNPHVLNLALVRWYGFNVYGMMLSDFVEANPDQVRAVILLVGPSKLLQSQPSPEADEKFWRDIIESVEVRKQPRLGIEWLRTDPLAVGLLRQRLIDNFIETPVRTRGPVYFPFPSVLDADMIAHNGSMRTYGYRSGPIMKESHPEWIVSKDVEAECATFRAKLPAGAKLYIGLTPTPVGQIDPGELDRQRLLQQWSTAIGADSVLTNLPATLPDMYFADSMHLNPEGQKIFTEVLAKELGITGR